MAWSDKSAALLDWDRDRAIPMHELDPYPHTNKPGRATIRELNIIADDSSIRCFFSGAVIDIAVPVAGIQALVAQIVNGAVKVDEPPYKGGDWKNGTNVKQTKKLTPLSLRCQDCRYVVYVLKRPKNWVFSQPRNGLGPFSVSTEGKKYNFSDGDSGVEYISYLISDGVSAHEGKDNYGHRINIHVDLTLDNDARIPLIIDPDIRHPGGSGEP